MGTPTVYKNQSDIGQYGEAQFTVTWSAADADDLDSEVLIDLSALTGGLLDPHLGVREIEWTCGESVQADVFYNSLPANADTNVITVPTGSTEGKRDFRNGATSHDRKDKNTVGGDLCVSTQDSLPGDSLHFRIQFKVHGTTE